jgi:uncharacterized protein YjiS (DUF1127 family)
MSIIYGEAGLELNAGSTRRVTRHLRRYWRALAERRRRHRLRATLCGLNDRELQDIGIARGEIDYVVSDEGIGRRGRAFEGKRVDTRGSA